MRIVIYYDGVSALKGKVQDVGFVHLAFGVKTPSVNSTRICWDFSTSLRWVSVCFWLGTFPALFAGYESDVVIRFLARRADSGIAPVSAPPAAATGSMVEYQFDLVLALLARA